VCSCGAAGCLANPSNNCDPNGHEIEGSLTAMNMEFSLNSFTSIPGASSATAFLSASPYGHGGPDVTATRKRTLNDMGDWFDALKSEVLRAELSSYCLPNCHPRNRENWASGGAKTDAVAALARDTIIRAVETGLVSDGTGHFGVVGK